METDVSKSESGEEKELEDAKSCKGGGKEFSRFLFSDHEACPFLRSNKSYPLPNQPLASIYGLPLIAAPVGFLGGAMCC